MSCTVILCHVTYQASNTEAYEVCAPDFVIGALQGRSAAWYGRFVWKLTTGWVQSQANMAQHGWGSLACGLTEVGAILKPRHWSASLTSTFLFENGVCIHLSEGSKLVPTKESPTFKYGGPIFDPLPTGVWNTILKWIWIAQYSIAWGWLYMYMYIFACWWFQLLDSTLFEKTKSEQHFTKQIISGDHAHFVPRCWVNHQGLWYQEWDHSNCVNVADV